MSWTTWCQSKPQGNYDDLEVTELSNDRGEMGIICPLFRGGGGGGV